ncbi:MAG TPA: carboxypeptidase regulatory-like domain-containing protein [Bryobacteraceae bacterium]|nr:carboxypeptidase regulatory-like domain-containing protein [Bryobacteraceae bacterium]
MEKRLVVWGSALLWLSLSKPAPAQSLGNAGTIQGSVVDPSGAAIPGADVSIHNVATGYRQSVKADGAGAFRLVNLPPNSYHLEISAAGFATYSQDVDVKTSVPIQVSAKLALAGSTTAVTVEGAAEALEVDPSAHVDADRSQLAKLPAFDPGGGLSQAITYSTGAVAADSNGLFHPLGDHAETSFVIDGQPISDQQSKVFSTQLPVSAIDSMTLTTGNPGAEFGDKTSLVAQVTTRTGLGAKGFFGNLDGNYGSFGTGGGSIGLGWGTAKFGNFLAVDGVRSGRFLDTPEFSPIHDIGNNETLFDRLDFQPNGRDALHLNLFAARNWIQIPNDYDQLSQDQRQRVLTWSIAPGYQHTFSSNSLISVNPYIRKDEFNYYGSADPLNDTPATQSEQRQLLNWGMKADVATTQGRHTLKYGVDLKQTRLLENFQFGLTDPAFNSPCIDSNGAAVGDPSLTSPSQCAALGYEPNVAGNPNLIGAPFSPALLLYDLTRGGQEFGFHRAASINQAAFYIQDSIAWKNFNFTPGFRLDYYDGLARKTGPEPRLGMAYNVKRTGTVLRAAYARTFETPFNENLLLSSATGVGGLAQNIFGAASTPIQPGFRNQFNAGFQQAITRWALLDADYFWKYTHNAYDFSTLLNTTITFPIAWNHSKLDGFSGRLSTINIHGFQAYWNFGHTRARYFPPETGGLVPQGAPLTSGVFRIDHDQAFQSTVNLRYQRKTWEYIDVSWRYDSGLVVSGVPDAGAALALTPNQQVSIGLACNGVLATVAQPLRDCVNPNGSEGLVTSKLLTLPQGGYDNFPSQENDDHNPDRVQPRNVLNLGVGTDNLFHAEKGPKMRASLTIENLTNKVALYNFLSTFSGTHFLEPRTYLMRVGFTF